MALQQFGKGALRVAKNYTKGYSDAQAKVREATSNDPWGPSGTLMNDIAQLSYNQNDFVEIMEMLDKRLNDKGKNWRHVFKSLVVLDYLLHAGSENVVIYFRDNLYTIKTLKQFEYVEDANDYGANIRQKAKDIFNLLSDPARLREEHRTRTSMRDRMIRGQNSGYEEEDENRESPPRKANRSADYDEDELELRKAIEASMKTLAEEQGRTAEEQDPARAIRLSDEEEAKRPKAIEDQNGQPLFDDQTQMYVSTEWTVPNDINSKIPAVATFANRSKPQLDKMPWDDALQDTQKVIELNLSSHDKLTHAALHGVQHYDEAVNSSTIMSSKLDDAPEAQIPDLRQEYVHPSQAEDTIQKAVWTELEYAPLRLLNTSTGLLCDRTAQISTFKTSAEYKELLSSTTKHSYLQMERITDVVATYFRCVLLSHRWEATEVVLPDIQDKVVYELNGLSGISKLKSFCEVARDSGYRWAWMDTCCIDKRSNTEVQESVNSMFVWYRHSALTIVYLSDVPPSSQPGALAKSVWNERGWTFQEFVAPKVVVFYQKDWSLYLGDRSPNHKESPAIMKELENATGIDAQALVTFCPGMSGAREKLQWASKRVTTLQEDVAYSLFGVFAITLPVIYGERKQNALGRLLQEIVARSGDITVLDWIGQPSEFNSCLPAHITSYTTPPRDLPTLSEDDIRAEVSSLRQTMDTDQALESYDQLEQLSAPRFANCRLHLPCISFRVTEVGPSRGLAQDTYHIKAEGLDDVLITTKEPPLQFSRARSNRRTLLLVRPWDRYLLEAPDFAEQPDFTDDTESTAALRLMVRLRQPFNAFLLARQRTGEYKRIASDHSIVAQVKDMSFVDHMDIGSIEIL